MKKQLSKSLLGLALFSAFAGFAQQPVQPCETYAAMEEEFKRTPGAREAYAARQQEFQKKLSDPNLSAKAAAVTEYTIPVVFHVLHTGGTENVSDATIQAAIDWVNKDLARLHSDANTVAEPFRSMYIPSDIKLMLAKKDAQGNCISGIIHRYDTRTNWDRTSPSFPSSYYSGITTSSLYPTDRYLNVIIVKSIISTQNQQGITVGYTYLPSTWGAKAEQDAIVYNYNYLGGGNARSLTHELGHWLNLDHTFGNTNNPGTQCGDDGVCDTPPMTGCVNINCCPSSASGNTCASAHSPGSAHTHTYAASSCTYAAGMQNTENIMNYVTCNKNFTRGQTYRMHSTLNNVNKRISLWSSANLTATDVNGVTPCKPVAEFLSATNLYTVCAGQTLNLKDFSYNGTVDSYSWVADNSAVVASPSSPSTAITFPNVGVVNIVLTVSNNQGTSSKTRSVLVLDATPGITGPHMEGFEDAALPNDWIVYNGNNGTPTWARTTMAVPYEGSACFYMATSGSGPNNEDYLQTPIMDFSNGASGQFEFAYAYARQSVNHNDRFKVDVSNDCGGSWTNLLDLASSQLMQYSGDVQSQDWYPSVVHEWKAMDLSTYPGSAAKWAPFKNSPTVIARFRFVQGPVGNGNNFFLDAINLPASTVGLNELRRDSRLSVYPNPAHGDATVKFSLNNSSVVKISVIDILGKEVQHVTDSKLEPGTHSYTVNAGHSLPAGIYNVNVNINGTNIASKLVIN